MKTFFGYVVTEMSPLFLCILHSHQSGEVGMASFCRMESLACRVPSMLSALEEHDFLFQLHLDDMPQDDSKEVGVLSVISSPSYKLSRVTLSIFSGAGGSSGRCGAVVDSQDAFHQLHLHPLQVRSSIVLLLLF